MPAQTFTSTPHHVIRWSIAIDSAFEDFRSRYEEAVPVADMVGLAHLRADGASWDTVLSAAAKNAPHGFMRYWGTEVGATMELAGDVGDCVTYLMGNHTIAERMYRHDPGVMLYAPLRTSIFRDRHGITQFSIDQPSTRFASFGIPEITAVGVELDQKVAHLLDVLGVAVPDAFTDSPAAAR